MIFNKFKLEDITDKIGDGIHGTPEYDDNGEFYFVNGNNLVDGDIVFKNDTKRINEEQYLKHKRNLNRNTLLISINGTLGNIAKYNNEKIILGKSACYVNVKDEYNVDYVYFVFESPEFKKYLQYGANGTTIKNVPLSAIRNYEISIPSKENQDKIVKILKSIEDKIKLNNKLNNNLYELAINYLNEKVEKTEVPVSKFAKIQGGYAFKSKDLIDTYTKNRIIKIKNLRSEINADVINSQFVENEVVEKLDNKFRLSKGDVAIAMTGAELGKTGFIYGNDNYYLNQRVGVIRGNNKASELYLNILFLSDEFQTLLNSKGYGSAQPNVSTSDIENILINNITEDNLKELYEIIKPIYEKIISNSEEILNLDQLRDTLLPKLMNGEIDLDNIEI